jgi:glycosyltransferase involved in cell wall biosynthesis
LFFIIPFIIRWLKPDVVIEPAHFGPFNLPKKINRVTVIHDLTPLLFPQLHRWHSQILQRLFLRRILKRTSLVITNSNHTAKDIISHFPFCKDKTVVVYPHLLRLEHIVPDSGIFNKFNIHQPYFLFTGTIEPRKNLPLLLKAFQKVCSESDKQVMLVIAGGKGWKSDSFYDALSNHSFADRIICTGYVTDSHLSALYKNALAFVYPSLYEGFGLPVAEALSAGLPILVSRSSGMTEAGGDAPLYFNPGSPVELSEQMHQILNDEMLRKSLSIKSLQQADKMKSYNFAMEFLKTIEVRFH